MPLILFFNLLSIGVSTQPYDILVEYPRARELYITWKYDAEPDILARMHFEVTITNLNVSGPEGVFYVPNIIEKIFRFTADSTRQCKVRSL